MLDRKCLIFDLGGVLLNINPRATADALIALGVGSSLVTDGLNLVNPLLRGLECGTIAPDDLFAAVAESMGCELTPLLQQRLEQAWQAMLCDAPVEKFRRLRSLREMGYRVLLLSNTNIIHWGRIEEIVSAIEGLPLREYFDGVYLSFEMHCCKPDVAIFEQLLSSEGLAAGECMFFDDSRENCDAAASLGIDARLMSRNGAWPEWLMEG